jgi:NAD(P)-dependent dehydrogenase (short-subunit alcohol dehydrogenase family)
MFRLDGKNAVVTGAGSGIGRAIAKTFAAQGARVFVLERDAGAGAETVAEISGAGGKASAVGCDVAGAASVEAAFAQVIAEGSHIDILVNNAGVAQVMPFALLEEEDWDFVLDTNVKGMFLVTKAFLRGMIRRKRGAIVNMGSLAGMRVLDVPVHYATAKSAVLGFTLALAREVARYGIRVNAVVPGMLSEGVSVNVPAAQQEEYKRFCTMGRAGTPQEVAEVVAFLASDRAAYVNAQTVFVDGGI